MEPPYEEQYSQESNPREYMTMRDYRNLAWQNQQPWERNPNPPRSMRDYKDHWMSAPSYIVPPQYISTPQPPQPPQLISPVEQAILDLTKLVGDVVEEQKKINAQLSQKIDTMENNVNKRIDGFQSEIDQKLDIQQIDKKLDIQQESILKLTNQLVQQEEESPKEECLNGTMVEEQCEQQPHQELIEDFIELSEGLAESSDMCDVVFPRENQEEIISLFTEEGSKTKAVEVPKKNVIQPNPIDLDTTATAQDTKNPLPVAPSNNQVYILPSPAPKSKPAAPAPKGKSNPLPAAPPDSVFILPMLAAQPKPQASTTKATPSLLVLQNIRRLVASVQAFATTSKTRAAAYIAWHSGWFGCGFGFGAPGLRHF